ncbi:unnamed protein product [Phytomonas sp. EM1]|nr:unnamed protein product [Phytomonas sp. EM1]|eukprot:CCW61888.1 unnamed protein product [Phytomonas sp. isolate EM1]
MFPLHLYFANISTRDYPNFTREEHDLQKPGVILGKHYALRGIRIVVPISCGLSVMYFYFYHIPRLAMAKRPLAKLSHYFYPSAAYGTPVGLLGGLTYGAIQENARLREDVLTNTLQQQRQAVEEALRHFEIRRARASARVEASLPWYVKPLVFLHLVEDPVAAQLRRMGLSRKSWQDLVEPNSLLGVSMRYSRVEDPRWYRPSSSVGDPCNGPMKEAAFHRGSSKEGHVVSSDQDRLAKVGPGGRIRGHSLRASAPPPPAQPYLSKLQTDALVSRVMQLQASPEDNRWLRTGGRFSLYGMVTMLVMLNNRGMWYRTSMGLGFGVVLGAAISATRLDEIFTHLR